MNIEMAYLIGMILGNGEIQRGTKNTTVTIDIPYKNLYTDDLKVVKDLTKLGVNLEFKENTSKIFYIDLNKKLKKFEKRKD